MTNDTKHGFFSKVFKSKRADSARPKQSNDGFANTVRKIGRNQGANASSYFFGRQALPFDTCEQLYVTNSYAARIAELAPSDTIKEGFVVTHPDVEADFFSSELKRLKFSERILTADISSRIYGGAGILVGVDDGGEEAEQVDINSVNGVEFLEAFDAQELRPREYESDLSSGRYNQVKFYDLTPSLNGGAQRSVHGSRVIPLVGERVPKRLLANYNGWGASVFQRVYDILESFDMTETALHTLMQSYSTDVYKVSDLYALLSTPQGENKLVNKLQLMNECKSIVNAQVIDKDKEDYSQQTRSVTGLSDIYDRFAQSFAAAAGMPATLLFGNSPGGLSTDDHSGARWWESKIRGRQKAIIEPALRQVCELLLTAKDASLDVSQITITFNDLYPLTESETLDLRKKQAEIDQIYINLGVLDPEEVRQSRFAGEYSVDTSLLEDEPFVFLDTIDTYETEPKRIDIKTDAEESWVPSQKIQENARRALEVRESKPKSQRGMTAKGLARARQLSEGRAVDVEDVKEMYAYFSRHLVDKKGSTWNEKGKGWQAWYGWGGDEAFQWVSRLREKIND